MGSEVRSVFLGADSVIASLGFSTGEVVDAMRDYRIGCTTVDDRALFGVPFIAGRIDDGRLDELSRKRGLEEYTKLERLFILTVGSVLGQSGVDAGAQDTCLVIASTKGNIDLLTQEGVTDERTFMPEMARRVAARTGFSNTPLVISNACISGVSAIVVAARLIREGVYRNVVVAGGDILTRFVATGFHAFKSVSGAVCRPYDSGRDGLTLGEGCGAVLLTCEKERAAMPCVEVAGGAVSNDANHISGPSRTGDGLFFAIRDALAEAGTDAAEVGFVNGHGTATVYNDEMESKAFALAGLDRRPVNGLKPYFGHMLGAAGVVESIVCAHGLREGVVYGTPGFETTGTPHALDVAPRHRTAGMSCCLKTASGFGGCNAAVVLKKSDGKPRHEMPCVGVRRTAVNRIGEGDVPFAEMIRERFKSLGRPDMKFYKMDDLSKLGYVAVGMLLRDAAVEGKYRGEEIGIVLANRSASLDTDTAHCRQMEANGDNVSPAVFVYTLPNVAAGEICIRYGIKGENTFFIADSPQDGFAERYARMLIERGHLKAVIYGWCELLGDKFGAEMALLEAE